MKKTYRIYARRTKLARKQPQPHQIVKELVKNIRSLFRGLEKANGVLINFQSEFPGKRRQVRRSKGKKARQGRKIRRRGKKSSAKRRAESAPAAESPRS